MTYDSCWSASADLLSYLSRAVRGRTALAPLMSPPDAFVFTIGLRRNLEG